MRETLCRKTTDEFQQRASERERANRERTSSGGLKSVARSRGGELTGQRHTPREARCCSPTWQRGKERGFPDAQEHKRSLGEESLESAELGEMELTKLSSRTQDAAVTLAEVSFDLFWSPTSSLAERTPLIGLAEAERARARTGRRESILTEDDTMDVG